MGVLIVFDQVTTFFVMPNVFRSLRILIGEITFASEEVIPEPFGCQPTSLRIRAFLVDIAHEAMLTVGLIFHKPEHCALGSCIVLGYARKELDRHGVHRAKVLDLLADFVIQTRHIGEEGLNILDNSLAFLFPVLTHAVANVDGASNQVESSICADMELHMMETVCNQLIPFRRNALYHCGGAMNYKKHEERLYLAELGELLENRLLIAVCDILSELIPDEEYAGL